MGHTSLPISGL